PKMNFIPVGQAGSPIAFAPGTATIGVRPEHLHLDTAGALRGTIRTIENLGSVSYAYAALPDETLVTVALPPDHDIQIDAAVVLGIQPGKLYQFDRDGKTLV